MQTVLTTTDVHRLSNKLASRIYKAMGCWQGQRLVHVYGVPRGGIPVALALGGWGFTLVDSPAEAHVIVDDIIDSGATRERYKKDYPNHPFCALVDKTDPEAGLDGWIVFPWEASQEAGIEDAFIRLIQYIGDNPKRGGLVDTPKRMAKAWQEWCSGYDQKPENVLRVFEDGAKNYDEMVLVKDIPFYSHCEHHLAPFFGSATIGYIPNGKIVGLSKLARLVDVFARRLQVQERLTVEIAQSLNSALSPKGVGVIIRARHLCMESRGIHKQGHHTETSALLGVMYDGPARSEFINLAK